MKDAILKFWKDEDGATAIEYGLIAGLIAVIIIAVIALLGDGLTDIFTGIASKLTATGASVSAP